MRLPNFRWPSTRFPHFAFIASPAFGQLYDTQGPHEHAEIRRLLDRIGSGSSERIDRLVVDLTRSRTELRPGTLLTREWDGHLQRVMVLADGFSWNGTTYRSLSKVAFAMTGTRWSGPRFFGLAPSSEVRP